MTALETIRKTGLTVLFAIGFLLPLVSDYTAFDGHHGFGWLVLSGLVVLLLILAPGSWKRLWWGGAGILALAVLFPLIWMKSMPDWGVAAQWLLILVWAGLARVYASETYREVLLWAAGIAWGVLTLVLLTTLVLSIAEHGLTHQATYAVSPPFSHRNLALEQYVILGLFWSRILQKPRYRLLVWVTLLIIALIFQARAAFLVFVLGVLFLGWTDFRWRTWIGIGLGVAVLYLTASLWWSQAQPEAYTRWIAGLPDVVKSVDPGYNLLHMPSTGERWTLWQWTLSETGWLPQGVGQWKRDVQGNVYLPAYDCLTIIRRPHNEVLLILYEWGWLLGAAWIAFLVWLLPARRGWWILLPVLCFSFPLERASLVFPLILFLAWDANRSSRAVQLVPRKTVSWIPAVMALIGTSGQWVSGWKYSYLTRHLEAVETFTPAEEALMKFYPYDFLLNHIDKYRVMALIRSGKMREAKTLALEVYERDPNIYGNYWLVKQLLEDVDGWEVSSSRDYPCEKNLPQDQQPE